MDCIICNKRIKYRKNWIRHINSKLHIRKAIEQSEKSNVDTLFETVGENVDTMLTHVDTNVDTMLTQKHECQYCGKVLGSRSSKSRHINKWCNIKKTLDIKDKENRELKKLLLEAKGISNTTNNNTTTTNNNNTTNNNTTNNINNTIVINTFGNESIDFTDDFLYAISSPDLSIHDKRLMLQNEIYSLRENKSLVKTNLRDTVMYKHDNGWKAISERLAIRQRIDNTPKIYKTNAKRSILNQYDPDMTEKDKQLEIDEHNNIANEMMKTKPTEEEYKELSETIRLDSYNARDVKLI